MRSAPASFPARATSAAFGLLSLGVVACGTPPPLPPRAPQEPVITAANDSLPDQGWGVVESARFFVSVPLPDRAAWRIDDASGRWLVATHVPSKSMLLVRGWRAAGVVGHGACEAEARPWRPDVFGKDASALVDRRVLDAPPGFDAEVAFAVRRAKEALGGVAVASFAHVRRCLVVAYVTRADGQGAPERIAERQAFVTERVLGRLVARTVDDRVVPAGRRQTPATPLQSP